MLYALMLTSFLFAQTLPYEMDDVSDGTITTEEEATGVSVGINLPADLGRYLPAYIYIDASGLSAGQKAAVVDAFQCNGVTQASGARLRLLCALGTYHLGQVYTDGADHYVLYVYMPRKILKKLKGLNDSRVIVFAGRWNLIAAHAQCANFFGAENCGVEDDPDGAGPLEAPASNPPPHPVPYGIDPNRGSPNL